MKKTNNQLPTDVKILQDLLLEAQSLLEKKDAEINALLEQLKLLRSQKFAPSSEKQSPEQGELFDEAEQIVEMELAALEPEKSPKIGKKKAGRKPLPAHLPRVEVIHDLTDEEKICPHDGQTLHKIGEEVSEQLEIIPAKVQVIRHIRFKYACRCCEQGIHSADMPKQAFPKSNATAATFAYIAVSKYQDAQPLYRLENIFKRSKIHIPRNTMANWMIKLGGDIFTPLINLFRDRLLEQPLIHYDETTYQVLNEAGKTAQSKSYMWVGLAGEQGKRVVLFDYAPTRAGNVPTSLLDDFSGYLVTDDYGGYNAVCEKNGITRIACWAHARRKFNDVLKIQKVKTGKAQIAMNYIGKLYQIEKACVDLSNQSRLTIRQKESNVIINEMRTWLDKSLLQSPKQSKLGNALHYLNNNWSRLVEFLTDGIIPLDNNAAENAIRPFVIGRKNWLHSSSVKGAHASAAIYSIIETVLCRMRHKAVYTERKTMPNTCCPIS
ncbi:IS66 family transposase [Psychromonas antarctica]|uniref:IS66 family transposase n=1 Tax=Psychromonas antarctica TaxID=67573 RepID=UPI001EE78D38|nr:IS66 family transposase [Psychromonas antarctica]MCG6202742.1 IS66 family transposase [Psychromonas antarctica]